MITTTTPVLDAINLTLDVIDNTLTKDGGCFDFDTLEVVHKEHGYLVGLQKHADNFPLDNLDTMAIMMTIARISSTISSHPDRSNYTIGTWIHEGRLYVEGSRHVTSISDAIKLGAIENQLCIWDCLYEKTIDVIPASTTPPTPVDYIL